METMNYDKIKKKSNGVLISFITFIVLGSGVVAYSLVNEQKPVVLGEDPLVHVNSTQVKPVEKQEIDYSIRSISRTDNDSSYKSNIVLPEIIVAEVELTDINTKIKTRFTDKYEALKQDAAGQLENVFTYKVSYKSYEKETQDTTLLSIVIEETITAGADDTFSSKRYGYVIDLGQRKILNEDEAAPLVLNYSYRSCLKDQIKDYIVDKNIQKEEEYHYSITGLEEFYIKDEEFHIIFNPGEPFDESYGIIDIPVIK